CLKPQSQKKLVVPDKRATASADPGPIPPGLRCAKVVGHCPPRKDPAVWVLAFARTTLECCLPLCTFLPSRRPLFRHIGCYDVRMTSLDKLDRIADRDAARARHGDLWRELAETIRLAAPMALTQLSQIAMMTTDLAFIGRLGGEAVAAAALAGTVYWVSFTFG